MRAALLAIALAAPVSVWIAAPARLQDPGPTAGAWRPTAGASRPTAGASRPTAGAERLAGVTASFLAALDDDDRTAATFAFDHDEREHWAFVPGRYPGVELGALDDPQRRLVHAMLRASLSGSGYLKTMAIMALEDRLRADALRDGQEATHRDPLRYSIAVFGTPAATPGAAPWGWRLQGHHVSWNFTIVDGSIVATTPRFLGANPHRLPDGPFAGFRPLGDEEDRARELLAALDDEQRRTAIVADEAPPDVTLGPGRTADLLGEPRGVARSALGEVQRALLDELVATFVRDLQPPFAEQELARLGNGTGEVHFAWLGSTEPDHPCYYRVHGPGFVIEYDNVQNGANHSHTVWHDLTNGFGRDLLRAHHEAAHTGR